MTKAGCDCEIYQHCEKCDPNFFQKAAQQEKLSSLLESQKIAKSGAAMWLPIETAPRDGTYILLARDSGYKGMPLRVEVCRYDTRYTMTQSDTDFRPRQPWITYSGGSFLDIDDKPIYWMPLPSIP